MEVGAPRRREALPFVGVDAGAVAVAPLAGAGFPSDEEVQAQGYQDAKDWYGRAVAPSLFGTPALDVELKTFKDGAALGEVEEERLSRIEDYAHVAGGLAFPVPGSPPGPVGFRLLLFSRCRTKYETEVRKMLRSSSRACRRSKEVVAPGVSRTRGAYGVAGDVGRRQLSSSTS